MADKNKGGRPKLFKSAEEMQIAIDKYFEDCKGQVLKDKKGKVIFDKWGHPVFIDVKPPTVTGLALALGFNSRTSLLNYQDEEEFMNTVTRAKARVEAYAEARLFDKDGANGAKFSLANNFKGWTEKQQLESTVTATNTNYNLDQLPPEQFKQQYADQLRSMGWSEEQIKAALDKI